MERNQTINGQCNLLRIGSYIKIMSGGWMGGSDYTQTCTTVLMDALGAHLLKLDLDGRVAELKQALLDASADMDACSQEAEADDTTKLITDNLLGMWVIHAIVSILALAAACMHKQIAGPGDEVPAPADVRPAVDETTSLLLQEIASLKQLVLAQQPRTPRHSSGKLDVAGGDSAGRRRRKSKRGEGDSPGGQSRTPSPGGQNRTPGHGRVALRKS